MEDDLPHTRREERPRRVLRPDQRRVGVQHTAYQPSHAVPEHRPLVARRLAPFLPRHHGRRHDHGRGRGVGDVLHRPHAQYLHASKHPQRRPAVDDMQRPHSSRREASKVEPRHPTPPRRWGEAAALRPPADLGDHKLRVEVRVDCRAVCPADRAEAEEVGLGEVGEDSFEDGVGVGVVRARWGAPGIGDGGGGGTPDFWCSCWRGRAALGWRAAQAEGGGRVW